MINYNLIELRAVHEYLLELEQARTRLDFLEVAAAGLGRLIPVDRAVTIFDTSGRMIFNLGFGDRHQRDYNEYYLFRLPLISDTTRFFTLSLEQMGDNSCRIVDWDDYAGSEFVEDFARPQRSAHTLGCVLPGLQLETSLHRSSSSSKFTEAHCAILAVISPHLSNLYSSFKKLCDVGRLTLTDEEIRFRYPRLTPREAQVGALLCRGLSTSEIATRLFVAIRTVEVHLAHLYQTLGVHSKRQAIALLTNSGGL